MQSTKGLSFSHNRNQGSRTLHHAVRTCRGASGLCIRCPIQHPSPPSPVQIEAQVGCQQHRTPTEYVAHACQPSFLASAAFHCCDLRLRTHQHSAHAPYAAHLTHAKRPDAHSEYCYLITGVLWARSSSHGGRWGPPCVQHHGGAQADDQGDGAGQLQVLCWTAACWAVPQGAAGFSWQQHIQASAPLRQSHSPCLGCPCMQCFSSVVGPNGSGKSNVIDAMLFVFGRRAKQVHGGHCRSPPGPCLRLSSAGSCPATPCVNCCSAQHVPSSRSHTNDPQHLPAAPGMG
jgi:hypothetical protein